LENEAARLIELLKGKVVRFAKRRRPGELAIEFEDGTRPFVDHQPRQA
jgi:hypothetical protein